MRAARMCGCLGGRKKHPGDEELALDLLFGAAF